MSLLKDSEGGVAAAFVAIADCNPFLPERIELERHALGNSFAEGGAVWHAEGDLSASSPNVDRLRALSERLGEELRGRLANGAEPTSSEICTYQGLVRYLLFARYEEAWFSLLQGCVYSLFIRAVRQRRATYIDPEDRRRAGA